MLLLLIVLLIIIVLVIFRKNIIALLNKKKVIILVFTIILLSILCKIVIIEYEENKSKATKEEIQIIEEYVQENYGLLLKVKTSAVSFGQSGEDITGVYLFSTNWKFKFKKYNGKKYCLTVYSHNTDDLNKALEDNHAIVSFYENNELYDKQNFQKSSY